MAFLDFLRRSQDDVQGQGTAVPDESGESAGLLRALIGADAVTREIAMGIPAFAACVNRIADTMSTLPIVLYRKGEDGRATVVQDDRRVALLNGDTGDTLTAPEMVRAMVEDSLCDKGGFAFVERRLNEVVSIRYVKPCDVSPVVPKEGIDPIFKSYGLLVGSRTYQPWQFIRLLNATSNGWRGVGVQERSDLAVQTAYATMRYEQRLVARGGNKKGFLRATKRLSDQALESLKNAWRNLYSSNDENVIVLNDGVEFQESTNTSVEMQLDESKQASYSAICSVFGVPEAVAKGGGNADERRAFVSAAIMPMCRRFSAALDAALLLESEKGEYFFGFDLSELTKADMVERWKAWGDAKKAGLVQVDEFRIAENMEPLGLNYVTMGLQDVLYDPVKDEFFIPNMGKQMKSGDSAANPEGE